MKSADAAKVKTLAIIQDSWSSEFQRPRGLLALNGHTFFHEILRRLERVKGLDRIVCVTSTDPKDDGLAALADELGVEVFRGDLKDVLSRVMLPIRTYRPVNVVRVAGSMPLLDSENLEKMLRLHQEEGVDLTTCEHHECIVRGLGAEVIKSSVLEAMDAMPLSAFQREFHTQYIKQNPEHYKIGRAVTPLARPNYSLSVGSKRDYILVKEVYNRLDGGVDERSLVDLFDTNPHLKEINANGENGLEIGLDKILLFPGKVDQISRVAAGTCALDPTYPISVELSLTDRCQLGCIWCSDFDLRQREQATMSKETVFRLFEDLKEHGTRGIVIEGGGEPTLHPDFDEIVEHASSLGLSLGLISNGVRRIEKETARHFDWVRVSLDASTPEEFRELKKLDGFYKAVENINRLSTIVPAVGVGYVLTNRNYANLESLVFMLQKIGVDYLHIRPVVDHDEMLHQGDLSYLKEFTYQQFPIMMDALKENAVRGNGGNPCVAHSLSSVISSSGNVFLCGRLNIHEWCKPIGNINEQSYNAIWNGKVRAQQAGELLDRKFCMAECPQCRMTKYNSLFEKQQSMKTKNFI